MIEKQLVVDHEIYIDLDRADGFSFDQIIEYFTNLRSEYENEITKIEIDECYIKIFRFETDDEFNQRMKTTQKKQERLLKKQRKEYERLKAIFDNENNVTK